MCLNITLSKSDAGEIVSRLNANQAVHKSFSIAVNEVRILG